MGMALIYNYHPWADFVVARACRTNQRIEDLKSEKDFGFTRLHKK